MAKATMPLLSGAASGTLAKNLTFSRRRSGQKVRQFSYPKKSVTLDQWTQRHIIGLLTAQWQTMSDEQKAVYNDEVKSKGLAMSGFNYFIKVAQQDLLTYHGLVAYWSMNQKTGATLQDNSGNGNNGILQPSYPSNSPQYNDAMIEEYGKCLNFDGIDDQVYIPSADSLNVSDELTLELWAKFTVVDDWCNLIMKSLAGNVYNTVFFLERHNYKLRFVINQNYTTNDDIYSANNLPTDEWLHLAATFKSSEIAVYVNGELSNSQTPTSSSINVSNYQMKLGNRAYQYFAGLMDEVRMYNRVLSADEIQKHYELLRFNKKRQHPGKFI